MFKITKQFRFSAAHSIPSLGAGHKCARVHGHNYKIRATFLSSKLDKNGFVVDVAGELVKAIKNEIDLRWDHQNLNRITGTPSAEVIAQIWFKWIRERCDLIQSVCVVESESIWAEYTKGN